MDPLMSDHVVFSAPATALCLHCGASYKISLPVPTYIFNAISIAFVEEHEGCKMTKGEACTYCFGFGHDPLKCEKLKYKSYEDWRTGPDTGSSSITIFNHLVCNLNEETPHVPYDIDDFGRCFRLLKAFPTLRADINKMAKVPGWKKLAENWSRLEKLYEDKDIRFQSTLKWCIT